MIDENDLVVKALDDQLLQTEVVYQMPIEIDYRGIHLSIDMYYSEKPRSIINGPAGCRKFIKFGFPSEEIYSCQSLLSDMFIDAVCEFYYYLLRDKSIKEDASDRLAMAQKVWDNIVVIFKRKSIDYPE